MIKEGDLLLCKKSVEWNNSANLEEGNCYKIKGISIGNNGSAIISFESTTDALTALWCENDLMPSDSDAKKAWYLWTYFYTPAELRDLKINQILEDD